MKYFVPTLFPLLSLAALTGCYSPSDDAEEEIVDSSKTTLKVTTRAASGDVSYPVQILAYDASGNLKGQQTLTDASQNISLQLSQGTYHLSALSGLDGFTAPASYSQSSAQLTVPGVGYTTTPLMMGGADVSLGNGNASVSIVMTYRMASFNLSLYDVPSEVTAVSVGVSPQYGSINMTGALSGTSTVNIPCTKSGDAWTSGQVYLMPGTGSSTTLTLSLTKASGQTSYSYELSEALTASVPYNLSGSYVEASVPVISGVLTMEGWQTARTIAFNFGEGSTGGGSGSSQVIPSFGVASIPAACSVWEGHAVALVQNATASEADLLLFALKEQTDIHAPAATGYESEMSTFAGAYTEGSLTDWSVPTEAEARQLKAAYADNRDALNSVFAGLSADSIRTFSTTSSDNVRYLCENGTKTFNFVKSGTISNAGTKVKYRMRLVKTVHVKVAATR